MLWKGCTSRKESLVREYAEALVEKIPWSVLWKVYKEQGDLSLTVEEYNNGTALVFYYVFSKVLKRLVFIGPELQKIEVLKKRGMYDAQ